MDRRARMQPSFIFRTIDFHCHNFCLYRDFMCLDGQNIGIMKRGADRKRRHSEKETGREMYVGAHRSQQVLTTTAKENWPNPTRYCLYCLCSLSDLAKATPPVSMVSTGTKMLTVSLTANKTELRIWALRQHCYFGRKQTAVLKL